MLSTLPKNALSEHASIVKSTFNQNGFSDQVTNKEINRPKMVSDTADILVNSSNSSDNRKLISIVSYNSGLLLMKIGKYIEAVAKFDIALATAPKNDICFLSDIKYNRAIALLNVDIGDKRVIEELDNILEVEPNATDVLNSKGLALYAQGKYAAAIENYERALEIDPNYADALNNKGNALLQLGKSKDAIEYYKRASELYKSNQEIDNLKGCSRDRSSDGSSPRAIQTFPRNNSSDIFGDIKSLFPSYYNGLEILIPTHTYMGEIKNYFPKLMVGYFNNDLIFDVASENKINKEVLYLTNQGIALVNDTKYPEALKLFDAVLVIEADFAPALYNKYVALEQLGNFKEALEYYKKAKHLDPNYEGGSIGLGETRPTTDTKEVGILVVIAKEVKTYFH